MRVTGYEKFLPEGWTAEFYMSNDYLLITGPNGIGFVTVDFPARGFRTGVSTYGYKQACQVYRGAGWKSRLITDAIRTLQSLAEDF